MSVVAVSIDGALVAPEDARISVFDRGLLYGDGCFEVLRTWDGIAVDLAAHLDRLYETASVLQLVAIDRRRLEEAVYKTIAAGGAGDHRIRIVLTRGEGPLSSRLAELGPGRAIVIVEPLPPAPVGLALAVVDWPVPRREGPGRKLLAYLDHVLAYELARAARADEAIRLDESGNAVEGSTSNLFAVLGGTVQTPPADRGVLPGIVRARILAICARERILTRERALTPRDLRAADELFVTSSLRGVVGVTRLDDTPYRIGPITQRLATLYANAMRGS